MKGGKKKRKKKRKKRPLKKYVLPPFYSHCPDLVQKKYAEKIRKIKIKSKKRASKMTVGTGSRRPPMLNTIPCVEIEQHRLGAGGEEGAKKVLFCKVSHSLFGLKKSA